MVPVEHSKHGLEKSVERHLKISVRGIRGHYILNFVLNNLIFVEACFSATSLLSARESCSWPLRIVGNLLQARRGQPDETKDPPPDYNQAISGQPYSQRLF